jgi:hypothetical protein
VVDFPDEASIEQHFDFLMDEVLSWGIKELLSGLLLDQFGVEVDLQIVLNHLPRDPRHL